MVKKSFSLTEQQDRWIKEQLKSGDFGNESEVIRALIRSRQNEERDNLARLEALRSALSHGEKGSFEPIDLDEIWSSARALVKNE
ncbi:MAG: type II toxin-antitoxin system ParD family antitoxin [bacterium]